MNEAARTGEIFCAGATSSDPQEPRDGLPAASPAERAGETPGLVARSAKSWLCHHSADRSAPSALRQIEERGQRRRLDQRGRAFHCETASTSGCASPVSGT